MNRTNMQLGHSIFYRAGLLLLILLLGTVSLLAQRFAYVDVKYVLQHMPEYKKAQEKLDSISKVWQQEIQQKEDDIDEMKTQYEQEKVFLSDKMKKKKKQEIEAKQQELRQLRQQRFGPEGDLFEKRRELIRPIQDKVYKAIESVAEQRRYDMILDKSAGSVILYSDSKYDKSDLVLKQLGLSPEQLRKKEAEEEKKKQQQKKQGIQNNKKSK